MARPSSIDRLPKEVRELIGQLRGDGATIDEIMAKLGELKAEVSRSAVGRHVKTLAEVSERMRRARVMAEALTARFGVQPDNQVARMNLEMAHGLIFELIAATSGAEGEDGQPMQLDFKSAKFLASTLKDLASAEKVDADRVLKLKEQFAREAAAAAGSTARALGMSAETVDAIEHAVLGVKSNKSGSE